MQLYRQALASWDVAELYLDGVARIGISGVRCPDDPATDPNALSNCLVDVFEASCVTRCKAGYTGAQATLVCGAGGNWIGTTSSCTACPAGQSDINFDSACQPCGSGNYTAAASTGPCTPCPIGTADLDGSASTPCAPCTAANQYQDMAGQTSCKTRISDCGAEKFMSFPGNQTANAVCSAATACVPDQTYETVALTPTSDRVCSNVTTCPNPAQYVQTAGTKTSNRVCGTSTPCPAGWQQFTPPTPSADRVCITTRRFYLDGDFDTVVGSGSSRQQFLQTCANALQARDVQVTASDIFVKSGSITVETDLRDQTSVNNLELALNSTTNPLVITINNQNYTALASIVSPSSSSSSSSSAPIIGGAIAAVLVIIILAVVLVVYHKRAHSKAGPAAASGNANRAVVAFENPMYDEPDQGPGGALPSYSGIDSPDGLYDEPAFSGTRTVVGLVWCLGST